ncbi:MAG: HAD-IIIA family hydrolase [Planctomycetota bacterium]|nr:HAD-IIIA family hydrolase [Planctomycetota bacterium]
MPRRAVFLDRDGVLNELALNPNTGEYESPHLPADLKMLPGAVAAVRRLQDAGFLVFIVSNQPSFAKGKATLENIGIIADTVDRALRACAVTITHAYYCYHHPQGTVPGYAIPCECRKPGIKSLLEARDRFGVDLAQSWMIGDQDSDIECGRRAGCRTVMITNPLSAYRRAGVQNSTLVATDLPDAVEKLLAAEKGQTR